MNHHYYMELALEEAAKAQDLGEVPIGAVVVKDHSVIGRGHNQKESRQDPTAHAEILAIREAASRLKSWRLTGSVLYVTLEPCAMCAGAIVQARLDFLVYGASDYKGGASGTCFNLVQSPLLNHQVEVLAGIKEDDCRQLLQNFFQSLRR